MQALKSLVDTLKNSPAVSICSSAKKQKQQVEKKVGIDIFIHSLHLASMGQLLYLTSGFATTHLVVSVRHPITY